MNILIIKHGALGDVVRTSYFAKPLKLKHGISSKIFWITNPNSVELLRYNPYIDQLVTSFIEIYDVNFNIVYSLDDELDILLETTKLKFEEIIGLKYTLEKQEISYCDLSSKWFDMGLRSKFGKDFADNLKKSNKLSHTEIFNKIFNTNIISPTFFGSAYYENYISENFNLNDFKIGINPFAGGRWKSKELIQTELHKLIEEILSDTSLLNKNDKLLLFGGFDDFNKNIELANKFNDIRIKVINTDRSPLLLAAFIKNLQILITSDSLALHLAIAQNIKHIAFFSPTSSKEIDSFNYGQHILSTSEDYCSYKKEADNSSITSNRIIESLKKLINNEI
jgi:heptosyltransferase-2